MSTPRTTPVSAGARCLAFVDGGWNPATIRRVNEDGTFTVVPDARATSIFDATFGVTRLELACDDEALWQAIAGRFVGPDGLVGPSELHTILAAASVVVGADAVATFWRDTLPEVVARPPEARLDADETYRVVRHAGLVAARVAYGRPPGDHWFRLYWNEVRMGGRCPDDIAQPIAIDDALAALGLADAPPDDAAHAALAALEATHGIAVPRALARLCAAAGALDAIHRCHPNAPEPQPPGAWELRRDLRAAEQPGELGLVFMQPHQGDHAWIAVFDPGEDDARVCLTWQDGEGRARYLPQAPTLATFLWDLAQTGACWYVERAHARAAGLVRTPLGWARTGLPVTAA